ncbi:MAG: response regulator [Proteobacteria bacterium]|nr:response regulator [Pseudomonadota bacterium]
MSMETLEIKERQQDVVLDGREICIVDDDELCRAQVSLLLGQKKMRVVEAGDTGQLLEALDQRMPDCILLDYNLVSENGLFVLERLRKIYPVLAPIVMVSADETQKTAIQAFRAGVTDFVSKRNLKVDELSGAIRRALSLRLRDEARISEVDRLRRHARFDDLTGLLQKNAFEQRLELIAESARRLKRRCGIVAFHVTRISEVQDRFGIIATDRVLRAFGQKLKDIAKSTELCGVWDRGTFVRIIDMDAAPAAFAELAKRQAEQMAMDFDIAAAHLSLSVISAHALYPDDGNTISSLIDTLNSRLNAERDGFNLNEASSSDWVQLPSSQSDNSETERRRDTRARTLKPGRIYLSDLNSTIDCTIRNLSSGGAGVRLLGPMAIPEFFNLKVSDNGAIRKVRKRWHVNNDLGVEFISESSS